MNFQKRIEDSINLNKKDKSVIALFNKVNFILVNEFHWSKEIIMNTDIPFILDTIEELKKQKKIEKENIRKRR
jgi:hypothetical protein